ncbi:hypothetical protein TNCV_4629851 [Trichonephila clavipes]|nr:hypothetical protein TNCV_4629851 [Trichonephila clavipes]
MFRSSGQPDTKPPVYSSQTSCVLIYRPTEGSRNAYHHVSDFDKGRIAAYRDCGLSYRSIAACLGRDPMTVSRTNESRFFLQHQDRRIPVLRYCGERSLEACILAYHLVLLDTHLGHLLFALTQDNARAHVAGNVQTFLDTENFQLLPWSARSPDLSPIENVWSMLVERLVRHNTPITTVEEL